MHLQPNGQVTPEDTMDPAYAAAQIVSVAALPNTVTVLSLNIMCVAYIPPVFLACSVASWHPEIIGSVILMVADCE